MEFFQNFKENRYAKHLTILYLIAGGMFYEDYVRSGFKLLIATYFISSVIFTWTDVYLVSVEQMSSMDMKSVSYLMAVLLFTLEVMTTPAVFYVERKRLRTVLKIVNEHVRPCVRITNNLAEGSYEEIDCIKYLVNWYFLIITSCLVAAWSKFVICLLTIENADEIDRLNHYQIPFPFIDPPTVFVYFLTYFVQVIAVTPFIVCIWCSITFTILILGYVKNQITTLRKEMKIWSDYTVEVMEKSYDRETTNHFKLSKSEFAEGAIVRERCYHNLAHRTNEWIRRHQEIIYVMKNLQSFVQTIMTINLSFNLIIQFMLTTAVSTSTTSDKGIYGCYVIMVAASPSILADCVMAHLFEDMTYDLAEEIYATPWYWLQAKERKIILNFLSIVQKTNKVKAFNIFPIALATSLKILTKIYSYSQVLHALKR